MKKRFDFKSGKVVYEADKDLKFFQEHDRIIAIGNKKKIEEMFRQDVLNINEFFDDFYKEHVIDLREVKVLILNIDLISDSYYTILKKIIKGNNFKKVILLCSGGLKDLNLNKYNIEELKKEFEVYYVGD